GFKTGGYAGGGGVNDVAGVGHGQEDVFNANAVRRIGVSNLAARGGGDLSAMSAPSISTPRMPTTPTARRIDVVVHGEISRDTIKLVSDRADREFNRQFGR